VVPVWAVSSRYGRVVTFVVVTGQPGSGKSTLAVQLADRLGLSLLAKDTIKEALASPEDRAMLTVGRSQKLGAASFKVIFAIAQQSGGAVLEASWSPALARERLVNLPHPLIEIHCQCPPDLARQRYVERASHRHWIHLDATRAHEAELWASPGPHDLSDPVIIVDTTKPVDVDALLVEVVSHPSWIQHVD